MAPWKQLTVFISLMFNQSFHLINAQQYQSTIYGVSTGQSIDGSITQASFDSPFGIKFDSQGNLIVVEYGGRIRKMFPNGTVITIAGGGTTVDGQGTQSIFAGPTSIDIDAWDNIYVSERNSGRIRKINTTGYVSTVASGFPIPWGLAVDPNGTIWVAAAAGFCIHKVNRNGLVTKIAGSGSQGFQDGFGTSATFYSPSTLAIDKNGNLILSDGIGVWAGIRSITTDGQVNTISGGPGGWAVGQGTAGRFQHPTFIVIAENGNKIISDFSNHRVYQINNTDYVSIFMGTSPPGSPAGPFPGIGLVSPLGLAFDKFGAFFVTDGGKIRKISCTTSCDPGFRASVINGCICTACSIGTHQPNANQGFCINCPLNSVCNLTGLTKYQCLRGFQDGGTTCKPCPTGTFNPQVNGTCQACPVGSYCNSTSAMTCPNGTYNPTLGSGTCQPCPVGSYCNSTSAMTCPNGTYNPTLGSGTCQPCPTSAICTPTTFTCGPGFTVTATYSSCQTCPLSTYKSTWSNAACQPCPPYSSCTSFGFQCISGYVLTLDGLWCIPAQVSSVSLSTTVSTISSVPSVSLMSTATPATTTTPRPEPKQEHNQWIRLWINYTYVMISFMIVFWLMVALMGLLLGYCWHRPTEIGACPKVGINLSADYSRMSRTSHSGVYRGRRTSTTSPAVIRMRSLVNGKNNTGHSDHHRRRTSPNNGK